MVKAVSRWDAAVGVVLLAGVATRLVPVLEMHAPLFADPAVEGTIARLVVANAGIPETWEPFAPIDLRHPPGYGSIAAALHFATGVAIPRVVLLLTATGQAVLPLSVYVLADELLTRKRAVVAALVAAMAAFPTFTFTAGMNAANLAYVLVPVTAAVLVRAVREPSRERLAASALLGTGMMIIHPMPMVLVGLLLVPYVLIEHRAKLMSRDVVLPAAAVLLVPLLLTLPYYLPLLTGNGNLAAEQWTIQADYVNPERSVGPLELVEPVLLNVGNRFGSWDLHLADAPVVDVLFGFPVGLGFLLLLVLAGRHAARTPRGRTVLSWLGLFLLFGPVQAALKVPFPGWRFVYPSRVEFMIMLPLAFVVAHGLPERPEMSLGGRDISVHLLVLLLLAPGALFAVHDRMDALSQEAVVTDADREAIRWMERNLAGDAVVLNQVVDVEAGAFVGGPGQWLPAYTGHEVVYPATSLTGDGERLQPRMALHGAVVTRNASAFEQLVDRYNVTHVFVSPSTMRVLDGMEPFDRDDVEAVCDCPAVYEEADRVVFRVE